MLRGAIALLWACLAFAGIFGNVRGVVHDPGHRPIEHSRVTLRSQTSDWTKAAETNSDGEFQFPAVPIGRYQVTVLSPGFEVAAQQVEVTSASAPILHFQLDLAVLTQAVETQENAETVRPESSAATTLVRRSEIEHTPGADRTNSLAMITDFVPGAFLVHGQLHIRGGHQVSWLIDGVPVPNTNIASNVGPQFDPKDADYVEVQRGGYSAEYGDRTYAAINVVPRTGFERDNEAEIATSFGSFHQTNDQISFGSHSERFAYYGSVNANRSDLGLATPTPQVNHDRESGFGGFATLVYNADQSNQLRLVTSSRRDDYQIPGSADRERESDAFVNFSWVHTAGPGVLLTVSPFYHSNRTDYPGVNDRTSRYAGAQVTLAGTIRKHNARMGAFGFGQHDDAALPPLDQKQSLSGNLESAFLEDSYRITGSLTLSGGVRLTHFSGTLSENAADPRMGASFRIPRLNWVLHAYYGRFYQAPPLSTAGRAVLDFAQRQGFGFLPLHGERDEQREVGLTVPLRRWSVESDVFETRARNFFDHDVLGNSNVFFPVTIQAARIRGWEATLRSPRLFGRAGIHLAYARLRAEGWGAVSGGLTDFSAPSNRFLLDHDQTNTLTTGFDIKLPWQAWAAGNLYYGSGFADNNGPAHLPGHTTLDLMLGKNVGRKCSVSVSALNVANRRFLVDNSLTFGGTHFADPRQVFVQVKYRFRY